ncbi:uncharacterized protein LOC129921442 isoform X2 [Episyrphus balteatus]|uniref:uncharacterized protein LOC129921442 isoform X2 n=1 Tax=Episyrphus balteatus TaxID=286459 RepID=UPI002484D7CC|nr:uncharacterized protein LOC129921442 isoform X2 [Episyrphus balteatus]
MVCRLCFNQSEDYIEIFSEVNISQYIQKFLELEISKQDPVSKLICKTCWQQLSSFQSFYTQIKEAQRRTHIKLKREEESAQMDGSSFEYVNTETDHDINETTEITIQNEELTEQIVSDNNENENNNDNTTTTDPPKSTIKKVRHYKKLSKSTRSFKNAEERKFFVDLMQKEEAIWNRTHNLHSSSRALIEAWKRISAAMIPPKTVHECKIMWKSLRDALRYERRKVASGYDQGNDLENLLYFVSAKNGQKKPKNFTKNTPESTSKAMAAKTRADARKKYKIQNYHIFDSTNPAWSERTGEGSVSDNMSAYSEGPAKHFSNNVSFETVTTKPHSTVGVFTINPAPSTSHMETMNEPLPMQFKMHSNPYYGDVKNEFKGEVTDLVESISKALNRLVTIATSQVQTKSKNAEFKYEYIWKLIECLYAQMDQTTINDLNQRIINMVYDSCKINVY